MRRGSPLQPRAGKAGDAKQDGRSVVIRHRPTNRPTHSGTPCPQIKRDCLQIKRDCPQSKRYVREPTALFATRPAFPSMPMGGRGSRRGFPLGNENILQKWLTKSPIFEKREIVSRQSLKSHRGMNALPEPETPVSQNGHGKLLRLRRTSGQADKRTSGQTDKRTNGQTS